MERVFDKNTKDVPPRRWLGLRPVDFVRAAERRAAVLTRSAPPRPGPLLRRRLAAP